MHGIFFGPKSTVLPELGAGNKLSPVFAVRSGLCGWGIAVDAPQTSTYPDVVAFGYTIIFRYWDPLGAPGFWLLLYRTPAKKRYSGV